MKSDPAGCVGGGIEELRPSDVRSHRADESGWGLMGAGLLPSVRWSLAIIEC